MVRRSISKTARLKPVLAVGGLDPSGHAGVLADLRVFADLGIPARAALTAVTAQSAQTCLAWEPVSLPLFRAQLEAAGTRLAGVKIGMLATPRHALEILRWLDRVRPRWVVWDPVLAASSGMKLFRGKARHPALLRLLARIDVFTPNLPEAEVFLDARLRTESETVSAALALFAQGKKSGRCVVVKGGHGSDPKVATDLVVTSGGIKILRAKRRPGTRRGTGCRFTSALLAALCRGQNLPTAARFAKRYVLKFWED